MRLVDHTTMPKDTAFTWDPRTVVGQSITNEPWTGFSEQEKTDWLAKLNCGENDDTFVSKLADFECFLTIIINGGNYQYKFIVLPDFQRFMNGPVIEGPLNWPDQPPTV